MILSTGLAPAPQVKTVPRDLRSWRSPLGLGGESDTDTGGVGLPNLVGDVDDRMIEKALTFTRRGGASSG